MNSLATTNRCEMGYAFISYSTKNQASADAMRELFNKHNIDTWMAPYDIPAGSEYAEILYDALTGCACLVLMLTDISQNSQWVKKEVNIAITNGKTVIPVKLEDVELNSSMKLYLNDQQIVPVHVIEEASDEIQKVLNSVISLTGETKKKDISENALRHPKQNINASPKKVELTVWSPVNTEVYLNGKRHLVMKIDHNIGFDYKYNSINVSGEFESIVKKIIDSGFSTETDNSLMDAENTSQNDGNSVQNETSVIQKRNLVDSNFVDEFSAETQDISYLNESKNGDAFNDENGKQDSTITIEAVNLETTAIESDEVSKKRAKGHLVSSYRRVLDLSKDDCVHPIEILMPDDTTKFFDLCDEFAVSNQKKYFVVRQKNESDEYLFFIFRSRNGKNTLISEGQDQKKVYRWFREKHTYEYLFTDEKAVIRTEKKKKHFAQDTAPRLFATSDDIPQILVLPDKYEHISANAFAKLNPNGKEIRQIIISDSVQVIDDNAFTGLVVTEAIHIPKSVRKMGHNAFTLKEGAYIYCEGNSYIYLWEYDSELIKDVPFKRTGSNELGAVLSELSNSNGITRIKPNTLPFNAIKEEVDELVIPDGICVIDKYAMDNVKVKNRIVIPSSVTRIGDYAFDLLPNAYVECDANSYAYLYFRENGIRNFVDISNYYRASGVCAYCGGRFSGLFKKKCSLCGKEKDY